MEPVSTNISKIPAKEGCTPISSSCIVWNGPDIPCINLCKGDTIEKVVYDLAIILCNITENVLDVSTLDFGCILGEGECAPSTILETLQAIINKICESAEPTPGGGGGTVDPLLPLPECLRYTNGEGDIVTQLPHTQYTVYIAGKICDILLQIASITSIINNINTRINRLENIINNWDTSSPSIAVVTQCLSNSGTSGQTLSIDTAFTNLETRLCEYIQILGSVTEWTFSLQNICIDGNTPLPCGEGTYGSLPNWVQNPVTAAASVNNLWVAFCAIQTCISGGDNPQTLCNPISVTNVQITNVTVTSATITWTLPLIPVGGTQPSGYQILIFESDSECVKGEQIASYQNFNPQATSQIIAPNAAVGGQNYVVEVIALYPCGDAPAVSDCGPILGELIAARAYFTEDARSKTEDLECLGEPYIKVYNAITVELIDDLSVPFNNPLPVNADFVFRLTETTCFGTQNVTLTVSIPPGQSQGIAQYVAADKIDCEGTCIDYFATIDCLQSWTLSNNSLYALHSSMPAEC
jgi:hypothetical protein